jgi:hypothetical protein
MQKKSTEQRKQDVRDAVYRYGIKNKYKISQYKAGRYAFKTEWKRLSMILLN